MKLRTGYLFFCLTIFTCLLLCSNSAMAQVSPQPLGTNMPGGIQPRDSTANKSNNSKWKEDNARIFFHRLNSDKKQIPDTSLHTFHRRPFSQPWYRDLGNLGSPVQNLLFTPENRMGPTLGYHVYDVYRFDTDSLNYYNTTRPYSVFGYQLGSKLEQMVSLFHTQNIKPNWNFAVEYRKVNSPGFYKLQRTIHDNASLTTNYKSKNLHYELYGAVVYNKFQQDENGGILNDSELLSSQYTDRRTVDVAFQNDAYSITRSSVTNMQRDFGMLLQHRYSWGSVDTTYNSDSTQYNTQLVPRFSITHRMQLGSEKHVFKDILPDSLRYTSLFQHGFNSSFSGGFATDSVFSQQTWFWVDNRLLLNGFVGPKGKQLEFDAGVGNRIDQFKTNYIAGTSSNNILSNYIVGDIKKEALKPGEWFYNASGQLYVTGDAAGDFVIDVNAGKDLNKNLGSISAGFRQQLNSAPYSYTFFATQY
ncbi:MAG: putative porin, partial [Flavipsychrobacter sp.]